MLGTMNMQNCRPRRPSKGFTLAEILIALGILAIGMSMVAALFPAAMEFNRRSTNSTLGTMICENGMVMAELEITAEMIDDGDLRVAPGEAKELAVYGDDSKCTENNVKYPIARAQLHYPVGEADSRTGFAVLVRKIAGAGNAYQLVTVAYRKTDKANRVELKEINCSINGRDITGASDLRIGTPLINKATGIFAMVDSINIDGTKGTLDIDPAVRNINGSNVSCYLLLERTSTGGPIAIGTMRRSPAIGAMSKVTGLKHDPAPDPTTP